MKSFTAIFLICYFSLSALVPRMDFDRLNQIPNLAAHFLEHDKSDKKVDFIEFVNFHYGNESQEPADGHELPFQKHNCISGLTFASFLPDISGNLAFQLPRLELSDTYTFHLTSKHITSVWQPPRV